MSEFNEEVRVEFRLDVTVNTGDFNNIKPGYTLSANVRPGEHPSITRDRLKATVEKWIAQDIDEARK